MLHDDLAQHLPGTTVELAMMSVEFLHDCR
jgi:hypothetical protein